MEESKIPQLRFPEFEGEWEEKLFGNIATFSKGKGISKSDINEDGMLECIRYGELYTSYSEIIDKVYSKTDISENELVLSEANDVIIPASGETQIDIATASCVLREGIALGGDLNILKSPISGVYLAYYLNNARKMHIARLAQGISVVHLYASQLKSLSLNIPSPDEQQKIATFLTAIDKRIQLLEKKKTALEAYKKGVMQKLFPSTGSGQAPEIRFKAADGNDFEDWEEKKLGEVCEIVKGKQLNKDKLTETGNYPCQNGGIEPSGFTEKFNNKENTITISEGGNSCGYVNFMKTKFWCGGHCYALLEINSEFNQNFLYQSLKFNENKLMKLRVGSGLPNIQKRDVLKFKINFPQEAEQQKIANFLSALDRSIEKVSGEIEASKMYKKGLLQQLFV